MVSKPWPLILLAVFQILTPVFTLIFNALALKVSMGTVWTFLMQRPPLEIFETLALMPIAGIAIFQMKRWSYGIFFGALAWSFISNIRHWAYTSNNLSGVSVIFIYILEITLALYFLMPSVRTTYFDPNVRWWEAKPRYILKIAAIIGIAGKKIQASILNLSEGGAFVTVVDSTKLTGGVEMKFSILDQSFEIRGNVVHTRDLGAGGMCYGIQFEHTSETQKRFRALIKALVLLGFQERFHRKAWQIGLRDWVVQFFKTGKGLTPELQLRERTKT